MSPLPKIFLTPPVKGKKKITFLDISDDEASDDSTNVPTSLFPEAEPETAPPENPPATPDVLELNSPTLPFPITAPITDTAPTATACPAPTVAPTTATAATTESPQVPTPPVPDLNKDCRFIAIFKIQADPKPVQVFSEKLKKLFTFLQDQLGQELWLGTWAKDSAPEKFSKLPADLPSAGSSTFAIDIKNLLDCWPTMYPDTDTTVYAKIRFITSEPEKLKVSLPQIGKQLRTVISDEFGISIPYNPIACQAAEETCIGWLFGSTKFMASARLVEGIRNACNILPHVPLGIAWQAIRLDSGKNAPWVDNQPPPSALHIYLPPIYAAVYAKHIGNKFKKRSKQPIDWLQLRVVPAFPKPQEKSIFAITTKRRHNMNLMRCKQQYFLRHSIVRLSTSFILDLDSPTPHGATLRRYLMNKAPAKEVAHRLFVSVDPDWRNSSETVLVTIAKYEEEARAALMDMIPECSYKYGVDATGWFISDAISAFQAIKWDPAKKTTVSEFDEEAAAMVAEDIFGMGDDWLKDTGTPHRPSAPEEYNTNEKTPRTAAALLAKQTDKRTDASSFGSMYNRNHDGDTVQTTLSAAASMQSRASGLSIVNGVEVVDLATASNGGDSGTAHTTKSTKATTAALRIEVEQQRK